MKIIKKILIICLILVIQSFIFMYKIIAKFWRKHNGKIKDFIEKINKELRTELQWQINLELEN